MRESFLAIEKVDKEIIIIIMEVSMKGSGKMIKNMVWGPFMMLKQIKFIKVNFLMAKNTEMVLYMMLEINYRCKK